MGRAGALLVLITGCSTAVEIGQECPTGHPVCDPVPELESPSAPVLQEAEPAAPDAPPLAVVIESASVATQQIALSCETPCAFVKAVAQGGTGPYAFVWEDGSTEPVRQLCPTASASYRVTVTDADPSHSPSSGPATAEIGVVMPSCEGLQSVGAAPSSDPIDVAATAMNCETLRWQRRPADWSTRGCAASIWTLIPQRVEAGRPHRILAMGQGLFEGRWRVELWGSPDGCELVEKLGEFSVEQSRVDTRLEFLPQHDYEMLVLSVVEEMDSERWRPYLGYVMCTPASATP